MYIFIDYQDKHTQTLQSSVIFKLKIQGIIRYDKNNIYVE